MSNIPEITSNIEKSKKREITIRNRKAILRKSKVQITEENYKLIQFLELFRIIDTSDAIQNKKLLFSYIKKCKFKRDSLQTYLVLFSPSIMKTIIESGLIYEFA